MRDYSNPIYKQFRTDVLKRDKFTCKMCKAKGRRKRLHVHHIRKWANASSLRYEIGNGITLCYSCHKEVSGKEIHYEPYLMALLEK